MSDYAIRSGMNSPKLSANQSRPFQLERRADRHEEAVQTSIATPSSQGPVPLFSAFMQGTNAPNDFMAITTLR